MENKLDLLLMLANSGDEQAFTDLTVAYKPLIESMGKKYAAKCVNPVYSSDDFVQEATLGFYSAVRTYKDTDKVTFGLYAKICIRNRLVSFLRASGKKTKEPKQNSHKEYSDLLSVIQGNEDAKTIEKKIRDELSAFEWSVFCLYIQKRSYAEMAETLDKPVKSIDNAICRIKKKIRSFI